MHIAVLAGGIGGARFVRGLLAHLDHATAGGRVPGRQVTVVGNTADDITLFGLRVCPDLDTVMYTLGGGISEERGWGRAGETWVVKEELAAYGARPTWFGLGDSDLATHLVRTELLATGTPLSGVTETLCTRWGLPQRGVRLLPMTDDRVETHVLIDDAGTRRLVHFQEYWVRLHAQPPALAVNAVGAQAATPAPGVLEALGSAHAVLLAPSNPVVSIGTILAVPGVREALRAASGPVVGVSPIIAGAPVRGMADRVLAAVGVACSADAVAAHYGARVRGGLLDGWLVDVRDAELVERVLAAGLACRAVPLLMTDLAASAAIAASALELAWTTRR